MFGIAKFRVFYIPYKNVSTHRLRCFKFINPWNQKKDQWPGLCKIGKYQSPIALNKNGASEKDIPAIHFENFKKLYTINLTNNGHTVQVTLPQPCTSPPKLSGGGLVNTFIFDNLHFHWPSEHTIDGLSYALEAHLVFYSDQYENLEEAILNKNMVTVVAILYNAIDSASSDGFATISNSVINIAQMAKSSVTPAKQIIFNDFLPENLDKFYTYEGSLTTPECNEIINWIVVNVDGSIQKDDLKKLKNIYTEEHTLLVTNNRNLQNINGRPIYLRI